jgi:ParB family chromosome partitioning protein
MERRPALGKGLSALIPDVPPARPPASEVDIDLLAPNAYQPRNRVDDGSLDELARSIASNGVIQPIVVRQIGERFQIIAGERRWRAAQKAGLRRVPIVIRDVTREKEGSVLEMALVENIQRENLNPIDEAIAYRRLTSEFQRTQEQVAIAVGKDRASVANVLRLLKLPEEVRNEVASGALPMGHARAILGLSDAAAQCRVAREVITRNLSVRETEALVKKIVDEGKTAPEPVPPKPVDVHTRAAEDRLRLLFGTRVHIVRKGAGGRIAIDFKTEDELIRIYEQLTGE